jgi:energy-coupling factor transporter transmembrane protein EcfT
MHPLVKILLLVLILSLMNFLSNQSIWVLCSLVCMLATWLQFGNLVRVVKRMRWLFASIFIIYAFGTPGEYIQWFPVNVSPTYEGCNQGLLQIAKLLTAIASLSMLFSTSSKAHLMAGLYLLLSPLKWLGFNVERFTALRYVT